MLSILDKILPILGKTGLLDEWTLGHFDNMTSIFDRETLTSDNNKSISDIGLEGSIVLICIEQSLLLYFINLLSLNASSGVHCVCVRICNR